MSDTGWNDPKLGPRANLTADDLRKLRLALERQGEEAHRRAPGRSQSDLHEHGTESEGVEYGRPVPPTAREDWHAQQREEALAEQARRAALAERRLQDAAPRRLSGDPRLRTQDTATIHARGETWDEDQGYLSALRDEVEPNWSRLEHTPNFARFDWHDRQRRAALAEQRGDPPPPRDIYAEEFPGWAARTDRHRGYMGRPPRPHSREDNLRREEAALRRLRERPGGREGRGLTDSLRREE